MLRLTGAAETLYGHHSRNMVGQHGGHGGGKSDAKPWLQCASCQWKQPSSFNDQRCIKCGEQRSKMWKALPPRSVEEQSGGGGSSSGKKGGGKGRQRSGVGRGAGAAEGPKPSPTVSSREKQENKKLQAQCEALKKEKQEMQKKLSAIQRSGQTASSADGEDTSMETGPPGGGESSGKPADIAQKIKSAAEEVQFLEQQGEKISHFFGGHAFGEQLEKAQEKLAGLKALSKQAKPLAHKLSDVLRRIAQQERCIANCAKQSEEARAVWFEAEAKSTVADKQLEEAQAELAKIQKEQVNLFAEATKRDVAPTDHDGAVGGVAHGHPVQLDVPTCQIIAQVILQQFPPEQATAFLAAMQQLDSSGHVPEGWHAGGITAQAGVVVPGAPDAASQAARAATSMAAEAERFQLEGAIAGGKGSGKGPTRDIFRPYEAPLDNLTAGSEKETGGKGDGDL